MDETTHSVAQHLQLDTAAYDAEIRRLVPHYDALLAEGLAAVTELVPAEATIVDLGGGTGAASEAVLRAMPAARVVLVDLDPAMLARARVRLAPYGERVNYVHASFTDEGLPSGDAFVASLALHHVRALEAKTALYARIHARLPVGGVFLNLDATVSADPVLAARTFWHWARAMGAHGIDEAAARQHFADWSHEDRYFSIAEELAALERAGFPHPECFWRRGSLALYGGRRIA